MYPYNLFYRLCFLLCAGDVDFESGLIMAMLSNTAREVCLIVPTFADGLVEFPEMFTVFLDSSDPSVVIGRSNSTGTIIGKSCLPIRLYPLLHTSNIVSCQKYTYIHVDSTS